MDAGYRTPLLDFFRRGDVARDVRLLAAQGALAPRALEQLGLLILLVDDQDPEVASAAEATLRKIPERSLEAFLARPDVPTEMRTFFAGRGIAPAGVPAANADAPMVETDPAEADATTTETMEMDTVEIAAAGADTDTGAGDGEEGIGDATQQTLQKIAAMNIAQRIKLAMKGSKEERAVLIRDSNKIVAVAVLSSPKLSETEVTSIARMTNVSEEILRIIAQTRAWVKNYSTCLALAKNSKTPLAVSMNLLARLNEKDLRMLSIDRNVPDTLRISAKKKLVFDK